MSELTCTYSYQTHMPNRWGEEKKIKTFHCLSELIQIAELYLFWILECSVNLVRQKCVDKILKAEQKVIFFFFPSSGSSSDLKLEVWELHRGEHVAEMCYSSSWLYREGPWLPAQTASHGASGHLPRPAPLHPPASEIHALLHPHHLRLHSPEAQQTPAVTHRRGRGLSGQVTLTRWAYSLQTKSESLAIHLSVLTNSVRRRKCRRWG